MGQQFSSLKYDDCIVLAEILGVTGKLSVFFMLMSPLNCDCGRFLMLDNVMGLWVSSLHPMEVSHHMTFS